MFHMKNYLNDINILCTGSHKSFPLHNVLWGKKIIYGIQIHKSTLLIKNGSNGISILYTGSHKSFLILIGEMFNVHFNILILH